MVPSSGYGTVGMGTAPLSEGQVERGPGGVRGAMEGHGPGVLGLVPYPELRPHGGLVGPG